MGRKVSEATTEIRRNQAWRVLEDTDTVTPITEVDDGTVLAESQSGAAESPHRSAVLEMGGGRSIPRTPW